MGLLLAEKQEKQLASDAVCTSWQDEFGFPFPRKTRKLEKFSHFRMNKLDDALLMNE